ncbi:MAG TPA: hypothetical protein PK655_04240 [archaeon]|jgi:hypothetical protein|nr:hypothetical protein [archaeon]HPV66625.1 hypothetical protein [archaeon]
MKIYIIASRYNYHRIEEIKKELENRGHIITLPNCFDDPFLEERIKLEKDQEKHQKFKAENYLLQRKKVSDIDAVLVINFQKNNIPNYIGGATFLEMYEAFMQNKKIFMYNPIPDGILKDEIIGFNPIIINGNIDLIK